MHDYDPDVHLDDRPAAEQVADRGTQAAQRFAVRVEDTDEQCECGGTFVFNRDTTATTCDGCGKDIDGEPAGDGPWHRYLDTSALDEEF